MEDVFVFGSNLAGIHGAGAAACAEDYYGAVPGVGVGLCGNSYAIPTKDAQVRTLPISEIKKYVSEFLEFARNSSRRFYVTKIGCGLAGYKPEEIAPLFADAPKNCILPVDFKIILKGNLCTV